VAKLYANNGGEIIRFLQTDQEEDQFPDPPPGTVHSVEFDAKSNAVIVGQINTDSRNCRYSSGVFTYKGAPETINAASSEFTDRAGIRAILVKLFADQTVTAAEFRLLLRFIFRRLKMGD
jgi:hypothetical protein